MCGKWPDWLIDRLQFNLSVTFVNFELSAFVFYWLHRQISQELAVKLTMKFRVKNFQFTSQINGGTCNQHFMTTKLFVGDLVCRSSTVMQRSCAESKFHCCLSLSNQLLWHWNGFNGWIIYARNMIYRQQHTDDLSIFFFLGGWL